MLINILVLLRLRGWTHYSKKNTKVLLSNWRLVLLLNFELSFLNNGNFFCSFLIEWPDQIIIKFESINFFKIIKIYCYKIIRYFYTKIDFLGTAKAFIFLSLQFLL